MARAFVVMVVLFCSVSAGFCGAGQLRVDYRAPEIGDAMFDRGVSMLGREQDEYATRLVANAVLLVRVGKGDGASLRRAERLMAVALHLSPKNKAAADVGKSLAAGKIPEQVRGDYYGKVFARLMMMRGQLLLDGGTDRDQILGRCFLSLAMEFDPGNKVLRQRSADAEDEYGMLNWNWLLGREPK